MGSSSARRDLPPRKKPTSGACFFSLLLKRYSSSFSFFHRVVRLIPSILAISFLLP